MEPPIATRWYDDEGVPTDFALDVEMAESEVEMFAREAAFARIVKWLWPGAIVESISWDFVKKNEIVIKVKK